MKRNLYVGRVLLALVPLLTSSTAFALANRVFVSQRSGNNANSCDNILTPCQTFAGAVLQLNPGGEAIVLDSGGYGPVTITQSVTIEAAPGITAFIHPPSGDAITINAGSNDTVILRGLTLNGGSGNNGIVANTVGQLFVEHCTVTNFSVYGVYFLAQGGTLFMNDDEVRKCGIGVQVVSLGAEAYAFIRKSVFSGGVYGVWSGDASEVTVTDCTASGNSIYGFVAQTTVAGTVMILNHVQALHNGTGVSASGGSAYIGISNSLVTLNTTVGVSVGTGGIVNGSIPGTSAIEYNFHDFSGSLTSPTTLQ